MATAISTPAIASTGTDHQSGARWSYPSSAGRLSPHPDLDLMDQLEESPRGDRCHQADDRGEQE